MASSESGQNDVDEYPPTIPGPGAILWRCRCGNLLGIVYRRWLYSRHRGRGVEATLPARVRCEACGYPQAWPRDARPHSTGRSA